MITSIYKDFLKSPLFNSLLLLLILSFHLGRAFYYVFASLIIAYFVVYFFRNVRESLLYLKNILYENKLIFIPFLLMFVIMTISNMLNGLSNIDAWQTQIKFFLKLPVLLIILILFFKKEFFTSRLLFSFVVVGFFFQFFDAIGQSVYGFSFYRGAPVDLCDIGLTGTTTNRNFFSYIVGFGLLVFLQLTFIQKQLLWKLIWVLCSLCAIFCILYSNSRGAWLAISISLFFLFVYSFLVKSYQKSLIVLSILVILFISAQSIGCLSGRTSTLSAAISDTITKVYSSLDKAVFGVSVVPVVKSNVDVRATSVAKDNVDVRATSVAKDDVDVRATSVAKDNVDVRATSVAKDNVEADVSGSFLTIYSSGRYEIWKGVSDLISQKPLLGFGMEKISHYHYAGHPHNIVLEVALYTGFLGLLAFLVAVCGVVCIALRNRQFFVLASFIYLLVKCLFDHTLFSGHLVPLSMVVIMFMACTQKINFGFFDTLNNR